MNAPLLTAPLLTDTVNNRDVNTGVSSQTGLWLLKTGFKPDLGFTDLHKNILYKE